MYIFVRELTALYSFWQVKLEITISTVNFKQIQTRPQTPTRTYFLCVYGCVWVCKCVSTVLFCVTFATILSGLFPKNKFISHRLDWPRTFCFVFFFCLLEPLSHCENCVALQHVCYLFDIWLRFVIGGAFINDTCVQAFIIAASAGYMGVRLFGCSKFEEKCGHFGHVDYIRSVCRWMDGKPLTALLPQHLCAHFSFSIFACHFSSTILSVQFSSVKTHGWIAGRIYVCVCVGVCKCECACWL